MTTTTTTTTHSNGNGPSSTAAASAGGSNSSDSEEVDEKLRMDINGFFLMLQVLFCFGLVWFGLVWFGLVWFGLVYCLEGMIKRESVYVSSLLKGSDKSPSSEKTSVRFPL